MPEECRVACRGEDKRAASYSSEYMPAGAARTLRRAQGSAVARECAHGHRHATHQPTRNYTDKLNRRQLDALGHRLIDLDLDSGSAGQVQRVQMKLTFFAYVFHVLQKQLIILKYVGHHLRLRLGPSPETPSASSFQNVYLPSG